MFSKLRKIFRKKKPVERSYPNSSKIIWNKGVAMLCDRYDFYSLLRPAAYTNIKAGEIIWIKGTLLLQFIKEVFPLVDEPFVLVTGDSTISLPKEIASSELRDFLASPKLLHWFAQNCDLEGVATSKVSPLPLGIDFHSQFENTTWRYSDILTPVEQENLLLQVRDGASQNKLKVAYADFQLNNTTRLLVKRDAKIKKDRADIFKQLKNNSAVFFQNKRQARVQLWQQMAAYDFVISPHGSGLDCHRTWEALVLGSYVIVEKSVLDPLYQGLPVKILEDYREISAKNLAIWKAEFQEKYKYEDYFHLLTNAHWFEQIQAKTEKFHNLNQNVQSPGL